MSSRSESVGNAILRPGLPEKCPCGSRVRRCVSTTVENPGRPFYHCESMPYTKGHLFMWVEEAMLEELEDNKAKIQAMENENNKLRSDMDSMIFEVYQLQKNAAEEAKKRKIGFASVICLGLMYLAISKLM